MKSINRILKEFPWLWAINRYWHKSTDVKIKNACIDPSDPNSFSKLSIPQYEEVWVYYVSDKSCWVEKIDAKVGHWLPIVIFKELDFRKPGKMKYVVLKCGEGPNQSITIFRLPKPYLYFGEYINKEFFD